MTRRVAIAVSLALPGILIILAAKPLLLPGALTVGPLLAFGLPLAWLAMSNRTPPL